MKEYVKFRLNDRKPRTNVYDVLSINGDMVLGTIQWYAPWRQYCIYPDEETLWSIGCLQQIRLFIGKMMVEQKEGLHGFKAVLK